MRVFDLADAGFRNWPDALFGLIFVAIGAVLFFLPRILRGLGFSFLDTRSTWRKAFPIIFGGFGLFWTIAVFSTLYSSYSHYSQLLANNGCKIAEGEVTNFHPMPVTGHANETFSVAGVQFQYSDYVITGAFNNSQSHGGPLAESEYVRICYDPKDNAILRLDIADYKGPKKDYGPLDALPGIVPQPDKKNSPPEMPWDAGIFVWLGFLSFGATFIFYRPFLRTFFTLSRKATNDLRLNRALEDNATVRLSNTVFRWNCEDRTLWLRPKGLNVLQIPIAVAKFSTDAGGTMITGQEIRLSSALPFIYVAFIWAVYRMFSTTMPPSFPVLGVVVFFGVFALIVNLRAIKRIRSRMEIFAMDGLTELTR